MTQPQAWVVPPNTVIAGPATGAVDGYAGARALTLADLPAGAASSEVASTSTSGGLATSTALSASASGGLAASKAQSSATSGGLAASTAMSTAAS